MADIITSPIKFLNSTVLSFNTSLGVGATESTLNVDLVDDCEEGDAFSPIAGLIDVGAPVYFDTGYGFSFGGILTNWTVSQGGSGKTYNVKVSDPRQLLENCIVIVDSYLGSPVTSVNYFTVYAAYEGKVLSEQCSVFGDSGSSERGMPYNKIIDKLKEMSPIVCSPTGFLFSIDFNSFPQNVPDYYRVSGPSVTILQLLQDVCDILGFEFYVTLNPGAIISVGLIDLRQPPPSFASIITEFNGQATELSYGQELRNEKTKTLIFGEKQHYLSYVNNFKFFFGEDISGDQLIPVVAYAKKGVTGFWIRKRIDALNASLFQPLSGVRGADIPPEEEDGDPTPGPLQVGPNGPYEISELDIRSAMASFDLWHKRALDPETDKVDEGQPPANTLNNAIKQTYLECQQEIKKALEAFRANGNINNAEQYKKLVDMYLNPRQGGAEMGKPKQLMDLEAIHRFVQNLGTTYYGKQWLVPLNQTICYHQGEKFQEKIFTDVPTNEGGWVDGDVPVLGLRDPELGFFRSDDNRINAFAIFNVAGKFDIPEGGAAGKLENKVHAEGEGSVSDTPITPPQ